GMTEILYKRAGWEPPNLEFLSAEPERRRVESLHDKGEKDFAEAEQQRKNREAAAILAEQRRKDAEEDQKRQRLNNLQVARNVIDSICAEWLDNFYCTYQGDSIQANSVFGLPKAECKIRKRDTGYTAELTVGDTLPGYAEGIQSLEEAKDYTRNLFLRVMTQLA